MPDFKKPSAILPEVSATDLLGERVEWTEADDAVVLPEFVPLATVRGIVSPWRDEEVLVKDHEERCATWRATRETIETDIANADAAADKDALREHDERKAVEERRTSGSWAVAYVRSAQSADEIRADHQARLNFHDTQHPKAPVVRRGTVVSVMTETLHVREDGASDVRRGPLWVLDVRACALIAKKD